MTATMLLCLSTFLVGIVIGVAIEYHARKAFLKDQRERERIQRGDK